MYRVVDFDNDMVYAIDCDTNKTININKDKVKWKVNYGDYFDIIIDEDKATISKIPNSEAKIILKTQSNMKTGTSNKKSSNSKLEEISNRMESTLFEQLKKVGILLGIFTGVVGLFITMYLYSDRKDERKVIEVYWTRAFIVCLVIAVIVFVFAFMPLLKTLK